MCIRDSILLGLIEALTYLASLSLIVGVVYEHGFPLSIDEVANLPVSYTHLLQARRLVE